MTTTVRTFQTRISGQWPDLDDCADVYGRCLRELYASMRKSGKGPDTFKTDLCAKYGIPSRLFNAIRINLEGMISSVREKAAYDLMAVDDRLAKIEKNLASVAKRITKAEAMECPVAAKAAIDKQTARRVRLLAKHQSLLARQARLNAIRTANHPPICFGSKRLFKAQHQLAENHYNTGLSIKGCGGWRPYQAAMHAAWRQDWRDARSRQIMVVGADDEPSGNKTCRATINSDGTVSLVLNTGRDAVALPPFRLAHGHDEYLTAIRMADAESKTAMAWQRQTARLVAAKEAELVAAGHGPESDVYKNAIKALRATRKKDRAKQSKVGYAITYRFVRDAGLDNPWRVMITITQTLPEPQVDVSKGALGIDFNHDHIAASLVDASGALLGAWRIPAAVDTLTTGQRQALYRHVALEIVRMAKGHGVGIVAEDLDFAAKKRSLADLGASQARMLSALGYASFQASLSSACKRHGVGLKRVNPAYTSIQGACLHAVRLGLSTHLAAAYVIARRGLCLDESVPSIIRAPVLGKVMTITLPEPAPRDLQSKAVGEKWSTWMALVKSYKAVLAARLKVKSTGSERRRLASDAKAISAVAAPDDAISTG